MALSLHIVVDNTSNEQLDRALLYLVRTQQRVVNIAGGAQLDRAMQFAERVRAALPDIDIIFRMLEDTGIHTRMSAQTWYNSRVAPYLGWLQQHRIILLLDNESSGDDDAIRAYVQWELQCIRALHSVGLNGAVCRFATGNIRDGAADQYYLLKPLLDELQPGDHVSPNEYSNSPGKSSAGHLRRYSNIELAAGRQLNISIGEAGVAPDYNPAKGYHSVMTDEQFVNQMLAENIWYRDGDIDRCLFVVGGYSWPDYQVSTRVMDLLESYYAKNPILPRATKAPAPIPTPPPLPPTGPAPTEDTLIAKPVWIEGSFNFRARPTRTAQIIKTYPPDKTPGKVYVTVPAVVADGYSWHQYIVEDVEGWIADGVAVVSDRVITPPNKQVCIDRADIDTLLQVWEASTSARTSVAEVIAKIKALVK